MKLSFILICHLQWLNKLLILVFFGVIDIWLCINHTYICMHIYIHMFASFMQRWFVDGSVKCFTGGHLPLAIVAILILILYMLLIIFVTAVVFKRIKVRNTNCSFQYINSLLAVYKYFSYVYVAILDYDRHTGHSRWLPFYMILTLINVTGGLHLSC